MLVLRTRSNTGATAGSLPSSAPPAWNVPAAVDLIHLVYQPDAQHLGCVDPIEFNWTG
jgi:hypothetical protein